jgi:epoxyqueuosine reductase
MEGALIRHLEQRGYQTRLVSIRRLGDLQEAIEGAHREGFLDEAFYQERLTRFVFRAPENMPEARSLIVVAYRDLPVRFYFSWRGERFPLVVPPTYLHWREKDERVEGVLAELLEPEGYGVVQTVVPKKLLAVCSGLAEYGKNNITYIEGMGSFHRLAAFCSDRPCEQDEWREPKLMERCERCSSCVRNCPTGAIGPERFLLRAERCITFLNEKPGHVAFPEWVDATWHNCPVGCMHCQRVCPENRGVLDWYEEALEFSEEETGLLSAGVPLAELPVELAEKLERWDLLELLDVLPRNLGALLGRTDLRSA